MVTPVTYVGRTKQGRLHSGAPLLVCTLLFFQTAKQLPSLFELGGKNKLLIFRLWFLLCSDSLSATNTKTLNMCKFSLFLIKIKCQMYKKLQLAHFMCT